MVACAAVATHFSTQALISYLQQRNKWNEHTFNKVNWTAHKQAMTKFSIAHQPFLCKLIHRHLPLGKRLARWTSDHPAVCPSCKHPEEDFTHFITCPQRIPWVTDRIFKLDERLKRLNTAPNLRMLLIKHLRSLFITQHIGTLRLNQDESALIEEQSTIGWLHILTGHFGLTWERLQLAHNPKGAGWQYKVISDLWTFMQDLWFLRNSHLHEQSPTDLDPIADRILASQVRELYDLQPSMLPQDRNLYPAPLTETLQLPRSVLTTWMHMANPAIDAALNSLPIHPQINC